MSTQRGVWMDLIVATFKVVEALVVILLLVSAMLSAMVDMEYQKATFTIGLATFIAVTRLQK